MASGFRICSGLVSRFSRLFSAQRVPITALASRHFVARLHQSCRAVERFRYEKSTKPIFLLGSLMGLFGIDEELRQAEEKLKNDSPLLLTVKKAIVSRDRGEIDKAEILLHVALKMARDVNDFKAETYIYYTLAEIAMQSVDPLKAEALYKQVLQRILSTGTKEDDEAVIEITLRLVEVFEKLRDEEKVNSAYTFLIFHQKKKMASINIEDGHEFTDDEKNTLALYGQIIDSLSKHHVRNKHYEVALKTAKEALRYSVLASGPMSEQTITLTNDVAVCAEYCEKMEEAIEYFRKAVELAEKIKHPEVPVFLINLGWAYLKDLDYKNASRSCQASVPYTTTLSIHTVEEKKLRMRARECMILASRLGRTGKQHPGLILKKNIPEEVKEELKI